MNAIVLAAGFGSRLGKLGEEKAKALLPLGPLDALSYIVNDLAGVPAVRSIHILHNAKFEGEFKYWKRMRSLKGYMRMWSNDIKDPNDSRGVVGDLRFILKKLGKPRDSFIICADNLFHRDCYEPLIASNTPAITCRSHGKGGASRIVVKSGVLYSVGADVGTDYFCGPAFLPADAMHFLGSYYESGDSLGDFFGYLAEQTQVRAVRDSGPFYDIGTLEGYKEAIEWVRTSKQLGSNSPLVKRSAPRVSRMGA